MSIIWSKLVYHKSHAGKKINKRIILLNLYSKNDPDINSVGKVIYIEKIQDLKALDKSPNMLKSRGE